MYRRFSFCVAIFIVTLLSSALFGLCACSQVKVKSSYEVNPLDETLNKKNNYHVDKYGSCKLSDTSAWSGEYIRNTFIVNEKQNAKPSNKNRCVVDYSTYVNVVQEWIETSGKSANRWLQYGDTGCNFVIASSGPEYNSSFDIVDCVYEDGEIIVYIKLIYASRTDFTTVAIPTNLPVDTPVKWQICHEKTEGKWVSWDKPMIYLYPEEKTEMSVVLGGDVDDVTASYPKYENGWNVIANPDGSLVDMHTGRNLYGLYYERKSKDNVVVSDEGFVVAGQDSVSFLEDKLAVLGLNELEAEEFIVYWLPRLESNEYNYIRFATQEEIEKLLPLEVSPKPDSTIRVLMFFKGIEEPIPVKEQQLNTPERTGSVLVEWGGGEIDML